MSIITQETRISINELLERAAKMNPTTECEFNIAVAASFIEVFLASNGSPLFKAGGSTTGYLWKKTRRRSHRTFKTHRRRQRKQKGGAIHAKLIVFVLSMILGIIQGTTNTTHFDVITRLKQSYSVSDLFQNRYGTCALNTLLFLKTINLPTFGDLSLQIMETNRGMSRTDMNEYLNRDIAVQSKWAILSESSNETPATYIDKLKGMMRKLRITYGYDQQQDVLTAMGFPYKESEASHAVVIWLTSQDDVIIIDPQKLFTMQKIVLYSSNGRLGQTLDQDKMFKIRSLESYVQENVEIANDFRNTYIFETLHTEIDDYKGTERLTSSNPALLKVLDKIRKKHEELEDVGGPGFAI